jgi:hypothetical protein
VNRDLANAADVSNLPLPSVPVLLFATYECRVGFDGLAFAAKLGSLLAWTHRLANTMRHEPRGLVRDPEHPVELMGGNALLA